MTLYHTNKLLLALRGAGTSIEAPFQLVSQACRAASRRGDDRADTMPKFRLLSVESDFSNWR
jgi:hypothetical protein